MRIGAREPSTLQEEGVTAVMGHSGITVRRCDANYGAPQRRVGVGLSDCDLILSPSPRMPRVLESGVVVQNLTVSQWTRIASRSGLPRYREISLEDKFVDHFRGSKIRIFSAFSVNNQKPSALFVRSCRV